MANCITCGRELRTSLFGSRANVCPECRASAIDVRAEGSVATPAPRQMTASRRPPVTTALVGINAAVFVMMLLSGVPLESPNKEQLLQWGANWGPVSLGPEPWRILTSNYVHIGIIHIALNMWCLWSLGNLAERIFDRWTYVLTYTACGIGGSLASLWWHPLVIGAGASGAIFGLAGALITALYLGRLPIPKEALRGTMRSLLTFAGYNLLFGAVGAGIDNSAHVGGLVTGLALGAALARRLTDPPEIRTRWNAGVFIVAALILLVIFNFLRHANGNLPQSLPGNTAQSIQDSPGACVRQLFIAGLTPYSHNAQEGLSPGSSAPLSIVADVGQGRLESRRGLTSTVATRQKTSEPLGWRSSFGPNQLSR